jgi:hypothetical protein
MFGNDAWVAGLRLKRFAAANQIDAEHPLVAAIEEEQEHMVGT